MCRGDWARLSLRSPGTVQVRTVRMQVRTGGHAWWGQKPGCPWARADPHGPPQADGRPHSKEARDPHDKPQRWGNKGSPSGSETDQAAGSRGSSPSPETSKPTGNPHARQDWEGTISTQLVLGSKHAVPGGARCCSPRAPAGQSPPNVWVLQRGPRSNLQRGITRGGAEKGFLTSCSQRVGGHIETLWRTAQGLWLGWGWGALGPR